MIQYKAKKIDITPLRPARLTGMGQGVESQGIHSSLEINALVFKQDETCIYMFSIDTLFISNALKKYIMREVQAYDQSILEKDIVIMSTHTHYAPSLEEKRIELGERDEAYFLFLTEKIVELMQQLKAEIFTEIALEISSGKTTHLTCNRRRKVRRLGAFFKTFIAMEPNLNGFKNEEFKIIKISTANSNKNLLGVIWSFPCHPTNLFAKNLVSAEFPGEVRNVLRLKEVAHELPVFYMPGFAGDVRAYPPKRVSFSKVIRDFFQLSYPVSYYRFTNNKEYNSWVDDLCNHFLHVWSNSCFNPEIYNTELTSRMIQKDVSILGIHAAGIESIIFRKISMGNKLAFYTISSEAVSEYTRILDEIAKEEFCIYSGYADEVFGYLPTQKQIIEGGYESKEYFKPFLVTGDFNQSIEKTIAACFREMN